MFINELEKKDLIPVFIELKDINVLTEEYEITDILFKKISDLGGGLNGKYFEYALRSGCFLFLLDGYDEILSDKKDGFFRKLDSFCDKYSTNYYVISSRPYSEFVEFQRFTVLTTCFLDKKQAISLIKRIEFDVDIKERFITALDSELYDKHTSFAANPLLLNLMLMTFDNYATIPEKVHLFYANAFKTLYEKHDATKAGYRRELNSKLSYDSFKKVFSYFCFISYAQGKIEFSHDELEATLKKVITASRVTFDISEYIDDLIHSLCVLYKEGLNYKFAHRSFQEYFSAVFLKELSDVRMEQMGIQIIKKDIFRAINDEVFNMLYDMAEERFEQNIILPIMFNIENECQHENKYDFYFEKMVSSIRFGLDETEDAIGLWLKQETVGSLEDFIFEYSRYYELRDNKRQLKREKASNELLEYLIENCQYEIDDEISMNELREDNKMYSLIKETWLGNRLSVISSLSTMLTEKQKETQIDLSNLLV